jgi:diadenosine tetraphosphatase ApaH/serine/threonine PP2A family protein phosphatase
VELSHGGEFGVHYKQVDVREGNRYIVNVGSVGQPRDGNPDATYVLLKNKMIEIKRVSYDILLTQKKMRRAGLPSYLVERLSKGR